MVVCEPPRYSKTELLATESRVLELAASGRRAGASRVPAGLVDSVLRDRAGLSDEQVAMVRDACSSGDAVSLVVGVPGSGKTCALEAARAAWVAAGYRVAGAALAAEAAGQLEAGSRISSSTLDRLLGDLSGRPGAPGAPDSGCVVVLDEASMVDTRRLARLLEHASAAGAKVVLCGDDRQLPSIEAGGAFSALARRLGSSRLSDNARQVEAWEREALRALREGRTGEAAGDYRRHGRLHLSSSPQPLLQAMVEGWWAARSVGDEAALYAYSREGARVLNRMARARAGEEGQLSGPELVVEAWGPGDLTDRSYRAGDEVCCLRNRARLGTGRDGTGTSVRNGTRGTVVAVDTLGGGITLATRDGRELELPGEYVRRFTDYGYAWTLHKGQGQTVGQSALGVEEAATRRRGCAFVLGAESLSAEAALVAASRATDSTELFVLVDPDEPPESPIAEAESLGRSWARSEHELLALDQLETACEIERLAGGSRDELAGERRALSAVVGAGPAADLCFREEDARRRLGAALVQRDEVMAAEQALRGQTSDGKDDHEPQPTREELRAVLRRRLAIERDVSASAEDSRIADEAVLRQARLRRERGSNVRSALDRLEVVDSALASMRRAEIEELVASPPPYVTGLLGSEPVDRAKALRWRQGLVEIGDWRRSTRIAPSVDRADLSTAALGNPCNGWEGRRRRHVIAHSQQVRHGLAPQGGGRASSQDLRSEAFDPATQEVRARSRRLTSQALLRHWSRDPAQGS
jgi:hypothetical protein